MYEHLPTGWNTWDYRGFNRLVHLDSGRTTISIQYAIWDETVPPPSEDSKRLGELYENLRWDHARRIGPHGPLGLPARLEFEVGQALFLVEAVAEGEGLRLTVEPLAETHMRVAFLFLAPDGEALEVESETTGVFAQWAVELQGATWPGDYFLSVAAPYAVSLPGQAATLRAFPSTAGAATRDPHGSVQPNQHTALRGGGALADAPEAMSQALNWNTLYDSRRRLLASPVSRDWCIDWRGPIIFGWDSFFAGLMASCESQELSRANVESALAGVDQLGFVPNYFMSHGAASLDRSMPSLGAYFIWKAEQPRPDHDWLARVYPRLRQWHQFWPRNRDGKGDGLLSWGSNSKPHYNFPQLLPYNPSLQHTAKCAMYESGLDNSPMYDDVAFNSQAGTLELYDVGLSSYYAMDCEALAAMAETLGKAEDAAAYRDEYEAMKRRINEVLWDEQQGLYVNRHWDGRLSNRRSPTSFFPLTAGVAEPAQARRMIEQHLLNDQEFWGAHVIPSIARDDPAYADNDYWRGRIWGPFNCLVAEGLRRYRFDDVAAELAGRGLDMFLRNWREDGGVYENYNADTGRGADVWNAARLYHWGGLLALIAIQELIDSEPSGYVRFGSVTFPDAVIRGCLLGGDTYDVHLDEGVRVLRNDKPLLTCTTRAIIRTPVRAPETEPLQIEARKSGRLIWHDSGQTGPHDGPYPLAGQSDREPSRPAVIGGSRLIQPQVSEGTVTYNW